MEEEWLTEAQKDEVVSEAENAEASQEKPTKVDKKSVEEEELTEDNVEGVEQASDIKEGDEDKYGL